MIHEILQLLYERGLSGEQNTDKRSRLLFIALEVAIKYIPKEYRSQALGEIKNLLIGQSEIFDGTKKDFDGTKETGGQSPDAL